MQKELLKFIEENNLSPFNKTRTEIKSSSNSIYKTKDAKQLHNKVLAKFSSNFCFADTINLWRLFQFTDSIDEIKKRQEFFKNYQKRIENSLLKKIIYPKPSWKPKYGIIIVTENENILAQLKELGCPVQFLISEYDLQSLEDYDTVQVIECEQYSHALERLPQTIFLKSIEEVYLERYLQLLSGWKPNLEIISQLEDKEIKDLAAEISQLLNLLDDKSLKVLSKESIDAELSKINEEIFSQIKTMTVSGDFVLAMLNKSQLPKEIKEIVKRAIEKSSIPANLVIEGIPVSVDENALNTLIKHQSANEFSAIAENIKKHAEKLRALPEKFKKLANMLLLLDFTAGVSQYISQTTNFPEYSLEFNIENSENLLLDIPKPISFCLNENSRCSILTGANSGGKTTLLEHILQLITSFQFGLPINGKVKMPLFSEVYYFAKNKGSLNKGAFETLLEQMSEINPGKKTLILADEIESVTEPGVAGKIISATADYFIKQDCFLVIATHLGQEINKNLPQYARIDGIEAKGLDEFNELIVDHNPVLGRLAHSTPELIIEKMFKTKNTSYFQHLHNSIKSS